MIQTLAFNAHLPVLLGASPFYQTPNAPIARSFKLNEGDFVKARLTALAIETDNFTRDDIYTLFVTTRILNFLKGLPVSADMSLEDLMNHPFSDPRTRIGLELLNLLTCAGRLYFSSRSRLIENKRFRAEIFRKVVSRASMIACQNGRIVKTATPALVACSRLTTGSPETTA
jgi:hypothetical protein